MHIRSQELQELGYFFKVAFTTEIACLLSQLLSLRILTFINGPLIDPMVSRLSLLHNSIQLSSYFLGWLKFCLWCVWFSQVEHLCQWSRLSACVEGNKTKHVYIGQMFYTNKPSWLVSSSCRIYIPFVLHAFWPGPSA